ncbi:MAG: helix-turn-helix transcriptional regulator [Bacteroidetes bacterium]|nr:helix-turn-helix transcriptional regulator [Bacteroidota bacterium]
MSITAFLNSIILLGSLQGFIIGGLLFRSSKGKPARFIAWLLLILAMACLKVYLLNIGLVNSTLGSLIDAFVPFIVIMPVGPLIYFYCLSMLQPDFALSRKDRFHFYPVIVDLFPHLAAIVFVIVLLFGWANPQHNNFGIWFDTYNVYADIPRWISLSVYLVLSFRMLRQTQLQKRESQPATAWLKEFLLVFAAFDLLWLVYLIPYTIPQYTDKILNAVDWYPIYLPMVAIIYWLGVRGFLIGRKEMRKSSGPILSEEQTTQLLNRLLHAMEHDKLYLDAELTLAKLANHVGSSPKVISGVLNQKLEKSFNEFINQFRIREIKHRLLNGEHKKYTLTALAYECGFNSQPTFQRAFKSVVGVTPSKFIQKQVEPA